MIRFLSIVCILLFAAAACAAIPDDNNGVEIECSGGQAVVTVPVQPQCPRGDGPCKLSIKAGVGKSVTKCGCVTRFRSGCLPEGSYAGTCVDHICTYRLPCCQRK